MNAALVAVLLGPAGAFAAVPSTANPEWIVGYATGALRVEFDVEPESIEFQQGTLSVRLSAQGPKVQLDTLERALRAIPGVERVEIWDAAGRVIRSEEAHASDAETQSPAATPIPNEEEEKSTNGLELFPDDKLFEPLGADPRWPRFSVGAATYLNDTDLDNVAVTNFGLTLPLFRTPDKSRGQFEFGIQGGVFSIFDLDAESFDLVNSDFIGGAFASYRRNAFSVMLRLYHQSSHLGDEFVLRDRASRVNLSFEVIDLLFSVDLSDAFRLYAGGGLMVHREPQLDRWLLQTGLEWESPKAFIGGSIRPLVNLDLQLREESDFNEDVSLQAGFQIEHPRLKRIRLRLTGDYYRGRSPNGQFYIRRIQTIGGGIHLEY